jgi:DNA-directed RNA polymerase subunit RPC12/RpoP
MDITFSCTKCGQRIVIDEAGAGLIIPCPKCGRTLEVPNKSKLPDTDIRFVCCECGASVSQTKEQAGKLHHCPKCGKTVLVPNPTLTESPSIQFNVQQSAGSASSAGMKKCPYCAEEIRHDAIKCKHCGEFLNGRARGQSIAPSTTSFHRATPTEAGTVSEENVDWMYGRHRATLAEAGEVSEGNIAAAYILALIVPFIGFFAGIYLLAKKQPGHGVACMAISVFAFLVFYTLIRGC